MELLGVLSYRARELHMKLYYINTIWSQIQGARTSREISVPSYKIRKR
jgi:hypothetical protein